MFVYFKVFRKFRIITIIMTGITIAKELITVNIITLIIN